MKKNAVIFTLTVILLSLVSDMQAAIYNATTSGNFSSTSTWQGGVVPPTPLSANDVIISSGVTVTLDQNLVLNSSFSLLQVYGTGKIISTGSHYIALNAGNATGDAQSVIDVDSVHIGSATLQFYGNIIANKITLNNADIPNPATITFNKTLHIKGTDTLYSGATMIIGTGSAIPTIIMDGSIELQAGSTFNLVSPYHVKYVNSTIPTIGLGFELGGTGIKDVEIAIGTGNTIGLDTNLTVNGLLKLTSGSLSLTNANRKLIMAGTSSFDAAGSGNLIGNPNTEIEITSAANDIGLMRFASDPATIKNLTLNTVNSAATLKLDNSIRIDGDLSLINGNLNIQGNVLTITPLTGSIIGGSANSYIITGVGGKLRQDIVNSANTTFPLGNINAYAPATITNMGSTAILDMGINVVPGVKAFGATGPDLASLEPIVNATWTTDVGGSTSFTYALEPMWSASMEVNGFDRSKYHISRYIGGSSLWSKSATSMATTSGSMYTGKGENITTSGNFAVFDENTLSINNLANSSIISLHPNPAKNILFVTMGNMQNAQASLYNISGQFVGSTQLNTNNKTIDVSSLAPGMYYIRLIGEGVNGTGKFVKQ